MRNSNNIDQMEYRKLVEEPDPGAEQAWARSTSSGIIITISVEGRLNLHRIIVRWHQHSLARGA